LAPRGGKGYKVVKVKNSVASKGSLVHKKEDEGGGTLGPKNQQKRIWGKKKNLPNCSSGGFNF